MGVGVELGGGKVMNLFIAGSCELVYQLYCRQTVVFM